MCDPKAGCLEPRTAGVWDREAVDGAWRVFGTESGCLEPRVRVPETEGSGVWNRGRGCLRPNGRVFEPERRDP